MELGYFPNSLEAGLAGNLLVPNDVISSQQQFYYEYSTDYLFTSPLPGATPTIYNPNVINNYDLTVSENQIGIHQPIYTNTFQPNSIESVSFESSVFLSPKTSTPSSAEQSPQEDAPLEVFDLSLDEIFDVDDILNNNELITNELLDVLNDVGCSEFLKQLDAPYPNVDNENGSSTDSSVSTPKRKYSSDSSDCFSVDSFDTCSSVSTTRVSKRARRPKPNQQERVARKKDQNKKAASRYRDKKKTEIHSSEQTLEELESHRDKLSEQVKKLQTEFSVILPLAKAAFTFDPIRREHLNQLISRINTLL